MCSAEGWQSREELPVSEACWTTYTFRTAAPVCQRRVSTNPLCPHYLPDFFFFLFLFSSFPSFMVIFAAADVCPCAVFMSHITYLISLCCLLEHESLNHSGLSGPCRKVTGELILTSPSPQRLGNTWRVFGHQGFLFSWAWSFGFEMKQEKTHTFNI